MAYVHLYAYINNHPRPYFEIEGVLILEFHVWISFFVGWANLLNLKMFQGSEATIPILLVPKYIPGYTIWLLLIPLSVFLAYPHTLLTSYPPNLLPSSSPPPSFPKSSFRPRIQFWAPNPSKQITLMIYHLQSSATSILPSLPFHPLTLIPSYPPNLLPSSSPPLSGPESLNKITLADVLQQAYPSTLFLYPSNLLPSSSPPLSGPESLSKSL